MKMQINTKFREILLISFFNISAIKFVLPWGNKDMHYQKVVKSSLDYPQTCKLLKSRLSKVFTIPVFFLYYKKAKTF